MVKTTNHRLEMRYKSGSGKDRAKVLGVFNTKEAAIDLMQNHLEARRVLQTHQDTPIQAADFCIVPTTAEFYIIKGGDIIDSPLTHDEVLRAAQADDNIGLCIYCGDEHSNCEPDMSREKCSACGQLGVYGAEELIMRIG